MKMMILRFKDEETTTKVHIKKGMLTLRKLVHYTCYTIHVKGMLTQRKHSSLYMLRKAC